MAIARLAFTMLDRSELVAEVEVDESFPDSINQAKAECVKLFRAGLVEIGAGEGGDGEQAAAPDA
jgi:hypothetical protein